MITIQWLTRRAGSVLGIAALALGLLGSGIVSAKTSDNAPASGDSTDTNTVPTAEAGTSTSSDSSVDAESNQTASPHHSLLLDIEDYYTAPLHWDIKDWAYFGGALAAIAGAHHYDTQVRTHFIKDGARPIGGSTDDLQDALPTIAALGATWLYAGLANSDSGRRETWAMIEAGGLSVATTFVLKFVAARERPDQTDDPNKWRANGSSFPSLHATAAFAVGTVLAESGNDDDRWVRRLLGYGAVAGFTAYERLKHNAHWLSDDVAGAAVGGSTAYYVMQRNYPRNDDTTTSSSLSVVPIERGAMLTYNLEIK
jgi:membrane-associated phospholipid phosphatase